MSGSNFEEGLARVRAKESENSMQGRSKDAAIPKTRLRGDTNPTKSGGINRPTRGFRTRGA